MILLPALTVIVCRLFAMGAVQSAAIVIFVTLLLVVERIVWSAYRS